MIFTAKNIVLKSHLSKQWFLNFWFVDCLSENGAAVQEALLAKTGQKTVPSVFVSGKHLGGSSDTENASKDGRLQQLLSGNTSDYDYDLFVVGGGSGGLACAKVILFILLYWKGKTEGFEAEELHWFCHILHSTILKHFKKCLKEIKGCKHYDMNVKATFLQDF